MNEELRSLTKRERRLQNTVAGVEQFLKKYHPEEDEPQLTVRLEVLEGAFLEFYQNRERIELVLEDAVEEKATGSDAEKHRIQTESEDIVHKFEEHYCKLKSKLVQLLAAREVPHAAAQTEQLNAVSANMLSRVKLPEIRLPAFSGKTKEWVTFRDTFQSLIHKNVKLTDIDRFTYLRSSVSGEALQMIDTIELSDVNYAVAWAALENRYENKKLIVKSYLDALFSLEALKKESYQGLNLLINEFEKNLQMLGKVGQQTDQWSTILAHMLCSRLDKTTLRHWETHHKSKEVPSYDDLISFLKNHCSVLQSIAPAPEKPSSADQSSSRPSVCHFAAKSSGKCQFCNESWHSAFQCTKFQRMKIQERNDAVMKGRLCRNCLQTGHIARYCERGVCRHCQKKHHSLLHFEQSRSSVPPSQSRPQATNSQNRQSQSKPLNTNQQTQQTHTQDTISTENDANSQTSTTKPPTPATSTSQTFVSFPLTPSQNILLSTALVRVKDRFGNTLLAKALLDSCSQHCLMTHSFANKLKFKRTSAFLTVQGIGKGTAVSKKAVSAEVCPRFKDISTYAKEMVFYVLAELVTRLPTATFDPSEWNLPESVILADPMFYESGPVDLIIGAEFFMDLLKEGNQKLTSDGPTLQDTVFGWVLSGRIPDSTAVEAQSSAFVVTTEELQQYLTKFWELETCRVISTHSLEEAACEEFFKKTTVRDELGRFVVALPKKDAIIARLGESKSVAVKRLLGLERRFAGNPELYQLYSDFIKEYEDLGHMKEVHDDETAEISYYLPHHAVLRPDSSTTKLRVVFDASCKSSSGISLNDGLMVGPVVQDDLIDLVLRFRFHRFGFVADITKMYRMVRVQADDCPLQRIVWRNTPDEPIRTYELLTVTYGTASAPYLATKCLQSLAEEGMDTYPVASRVLKHDFYVDDLLTGVDNLEEGAMLVKDIIELLQSGGFELRKWNSNSKELLSTIPEHLRDKQSVTMLESASYTVKTLGLVWKPSTDEFVFSTPKWNMSSVITKRIVVSDTSMHWDPLGIAGPVVVQAKLFVQGLWKKQYTWDEPLSADDQEFWLEYRRNLAALDGLSVPRWVGLSRNTVEVQFHGFCDASEKAYGACLYVRTVSEDGQVDVHLLIAKSRIAPLEKPKKKKQSQQVELSDENRKQTMPRLELSSALLLAHVYEKVVNSVPFQAKAYFWTDSMISLCQLSASPSRWKTFVANRVSETQRITKNGIWNHVPGTENPADIISRGMSPAQLQYQSIWFHGPHWLRLDKANWPTVQQVREDDVDRSLLEERSVAVVLPAVPPSEIFMLRSTLKNTVRLTAHLLRFRYNANHRDSRKVGALTVEEYDDALKHLVRLAQKESFAQELTDLANNRQVRDSSTISALNPQMIDGILCVGGRLRNASVSDTRKHPYILDHRHPFAELVMNDYHRRLYHVGQQALVASVRELFWPTHARDLARKVIHACVPCFRAKPRIHDQLMGELPPERVTPCTPFERVGVDYCGPFNVVYPPRRRHGEKCFVAVFICLVTKAIHLELVANLSTEAFLAALRRFYGRRGKPRLIMCDNATNFVGARRQLDELLTLFTNQQFQDSVKKEAVDSRIEFRFIPPRTPNFGGLWESAVKSFKLLFKRTIGTHKLYYDEMQTVLIQIEAILNSRPLTPLSNDPGDYEALTPGHFLIQRPFVAIPEPDLHSIPENRLSAWQRVQSYMQTLWKLWSQRYLSDLHNRTKWTKKRDNIAVGTMVVLKDINQPPLKWPLARVTEVHAGSDGNVRVVTLRTKDGDSTSRGISKICVLPIRDNIVPSSTSGEN